MNEQNEIYGWYEHLLTASLQGKLESIANAEAHISDPDIEALRSMLAFHLRPLVVAALEDRSSAEQLALISDLVRVLSTVDESIRGETPGARFLRMLPDPRVVTAAQVSALIEAQMPRTGFSHSELFTGSQRSLSLDDEIRREILTSSQIDMLVSFIRWSGLRLVMDAVKQAIDGGSAVRVISTVYLGATEQKAITTLKEAGADVRLSYNTTRGRLHAKAWVFHRRHGLGSVYVGSSNLSRDALLDGLEWNVKATERELSSLFKRTSDSFEALWNDPEFERYETADADRLRHALEQASFGSGSYRLRDLPIELRRRVESELQERGLAKPEAQYDLAQLRPYPFQQEVLDRLESERELHGRRRNLVVIPTGAGKTVVAAFDYARVCAALGRRLRLLFVAHREELLLQARTVFRRVLKDPSFGELWKGSEEPQSWLHVFGSIQTIAQRVGKFQRRWPAGDGFEFLVVDEAHHGAASSYRFVLDSLHPSILLGLTATPERMDGSVIAEDFDGHFASEIRLGDGIRKGLLVPFHYFGVAEGMPDLRDVAWNGRYVLNDLERKLIRQPYADAVRAALGRVIARPDKVRALGFCATIKHAEFMSDQFNKAGLPALWLSGEDDRDRRQAAIRSLSEGAIQYVFTVDLFNEGVDIPSIDTVLFLRPTESLTIFLQQMGRGLRSSPDKDILTILDFVGQAHQKYDISHKFRAMLGCGKAQVRDEIRGGYPSLPPGCAIVLERQAQENILKHIASQIPGSRESLLSLVREDPTAGFVKFLAQTGFEAELMLKRGGLWYQMAREVTSRPTLDDNLEKSLAKFVYNVLLQIDSIQQIDLWLQAIRTASSARDYKGADWLTQEWASFGSGGIWPDQESMWTWLRSDPERTSEIVEWMEWQRDQIETIERSLPAYPGLNLFASYSQKGIAFCQQRASWGQANVSQSGVLPVTSAAQMIRLYNLFVTVRKSESDYSRDTMYRDWAVTMDEFHWESPNNWVQDRGGGKKFLDQVAAGMPVLLFVREKKKDDWGRTPPYLFLGPVKLVQSSVEGQRPIAMRFKLPFPMPTAEFRKLCMEVAV